MTPTVAVNRTTTQTIAVTSSIAVNRSVAPSVFTNQPITPTPSPSVTVNRSITPSVGVRPSVTTSVPVNLSVTTFTQSVALNRSFASSVRVNQTIIPTARSVAVTQTVIGNQSLTPTPSFVVPTSAVVSQSVSPVNQSTSQTVLVSRSLRLSPSAVLVNQSTTPSVFLNQTVRLSATQTQSVRVTSSSRSVAVNQTTTPSVLVSRLVTTTTFANQSVVLTPSSVAETQSVIPTTGFRGLNQTSTTVSVGINATSTVASRTSAIAPSSAVLRTSSGTPTTQTNTTLVQPTATVNVSSAVFRSLQPSPTVVNITRVPVTTPAPTGVNVSSTLLPTLNFTTFMSTAVLNTFSQAVVRTTSLNIIPSQSVSNFSSSAGLNSTSAALTRAPSVRLTRTTATPVLSTTTPAVSVTPMPTPLPLCPDEPLPTRKDPMAPVKVDLMGQGVVTSEVSSASSLEYSVSYNRLVSYLAGDGEVSSSLGSAIRTASLPSRQPVGPFNVTCAVSSSTVWPDVGGLHVAGQVRDNSFNTFEGMEISVSYNGSTFNSCTTPASGVCSVSLNLTNYFTTESRIITLQVYTDSQPQNSCEMDVTLMPRVEQYSMDELFMVLPQRLVAEGEEILIPIIATFNTRVLTFSFDCTISGSAVIAGTNSPFNFSRIENYNSSSRVFITGFRVYDKANTRETDFAQEELFSLVIANINSNVSVQCQTLRLQLTNLAHLSTEHPFVAAFNDNGAAGVLTLETGTPMTTLFAYTPENEVLNVAPLTTRVYTFPIYVVRFTAEGTIEDVPTISDCSVESPQIVKVSNNCFSFFFDGSETQGASQTNITLQADDVSVVLPLRVWLASMDINITADDTTLNAIKTCSEMLYQRTQLSIWTTITTGDSEPVSVSVTPLLARNVTAQDNTIVYVSESGLVQGLQAGISRISVNGFDAAVIEITVSNDTVVPTYVDLFAFSGVDVSTTTNTLSLTLEQDFALVYSPLQLVAVAQFDDDQTMPLTEDDGLVFMLETSTGVVDMVTDGYVIRSPVDVLNVTALWRIAGQDCCRVLTDNTTIQTMVPDPYVEVTLSSTNLTSATDISSTNLTSANDILSFYGVPTALYIDVVLVYDSGERVSVAGDNRTVINVTEGLTLDNLTVRMDTMSSATTATVTAMFDEMLPDSSTIELVTSTITLAAYPRYGPSDTQPISSLHPIGNSGVYQQAIIKAFLTHPDSIPIRDITNNVSISVLTTDAELSEENPMVLSILNTDIGSTVTLQAEFMRDGTSFANDSLSLNISSDSVTVWSIDNITMCPSSEINTYHLDCSVTLEDGTMLPSTFTNGNQLYPNLISFDIDDTSVVMKRGNATIVLRKNAPFNVTAMAGSEMYSREFCSNLQPVGGEVDLGNKDGLPIPPQVAGGELEIPVRLNTANMPLGVFGLELNMQPPMELEDVVQGSDWMNGSIVFTEREDGTVQFGGVLNTGARELAEIAILKFRVVDDPGVMVSLNVTASYLSNTSIPPGDITIADVFSASQVVFEVMSDSGSRRRRSVQTSSSHTSVRHRRQADRLDVTGDGLVDLRDVFVLLEYIAAETYNFTSDIGTIIRDTTGRLSDVDITTIEEVERTALDLAFTVQVTADLQYVNNSCKLVINGTVSRDGDSGRDVPLDGTVKVAFLFESSNQSILAEFESIFSGSVIERTDSGGLVTANLIQDGAAALFEVVADGDLSIDFSLKTYLLIETGVEIGNVTLSAITSIDAEEVNQRDFGNVSETCFPPPVPSTSTVAPTTSIQPSTTMLIVPTTSMLSSTVPTVEATSMLPSTTLDAPSSTALSSPALSSSTQVSSTALTTSSQLSSSTMDALASSTVAVSSTPMVAVQITSTVESSIEVTTQQTTTSTPVPVQSTTVAIVESSSSSVAAPTPSSTIQPSSTIMSGIETTSQPGEPIPSTSSADSPSSTVDSPTIAITETSSPVPNTEPPTRETTETTPTIGVTETTSTTNTQQPITAIGGALGAIIAILLAIVFVFVAVYVWRRQRKSRRYSPNAPRPSSRASDFWFGEEEKVEMSPIDIVPLHHAQHSQMHETSIDLIPNHHIYHSGTGDDVLMSGHSGRPLLRDHPQQGRPPPQLAKQAVKQPFYSETGPTDMPASTYQTGATSRNTSSPYADYEEDELIDLRFHDDPANTYLSLGLTPLSQIDNYPASNDMLESGSEGLGFFPSMPPPVSPMSSVFNINTSGIPVDSPFIINGKDPMVSSSGGMVMPDAIPDTRRSVVGGRKGKLDMNLLSQGYAMKLETVPEQSGSLMSENGFEGKYNHAGIIANGNVETSSSSDSFGTGEETGLIFPSADASSNLSLQRQGGKRRKSGTRRDLNDSQEFGRGMMFQNREVDDVDMPVKLDRFGSMSPASEDRYIRARAREKEIAKQKELQKQRQLEDEQRKRYLQEQRAKQIASDYGSTRAREAGADMFRNKPPINYGSRSRPYPSNSVFRETMKLEAQLQLEQEKGPAYDQQKRQREQHAEEGIIRKYDQLTTL